MIAIEVYQFVVSCMLRFKDATGQGSDEIEQMRPSIRYTPWII